MSMMLPFQGSFASAAALLLLLLVATTTTTATSAAAGNSQEERDNSLLQWVRPLGLQPFTDHFEWNAFCAVRLVESAVPQTHVYKDLLTGELKKKDVDTNADAENSESTVLSDSIFVDSRFNSTSCAGNPSQLAWVQRVENEQEWNRLVRTKVSALSSSSFDGDEDGSSGTMWLLEVEAKSAARGALRALPRDAHIHRRANSSTIFAMAYLSTQDARAFAAAWDPVAIFPAPDELKIAPSAYLLTHPEAVASLLSSSEEPHDSSIRRTPSLLDEEVDILVMLHDPVDAVSTADDHVAELLRQCQSWLMQRNISGKAVRAGARRLVVSMRRGVAEEALPDLLHRILLPQPEVLFVEARERFKLHNQFVITHSLRRQTLLLVPSRRSIICVQRFHPRTLQILSAGTPLRLLRMERSQMEQNPCTTRACRALGRLWVLAIRVWMSAPAFSTRRKTIFLKTE